MDYVATITAEDNRQNNQQKPHGDLKIVGSESFSDAESAYVKHEKTISRKELTSRLNHINFLDQHIYINFEHIRDKRILSFHAKPQICFGKRLACLWNEKCDARMLQDFYRFRDCTLTDDDGLITINASLRAFNSKGICVTLPDTFCKATARRSQRHACDPLTVQIIQNSVIFYGALIDFSPLAFHVEIHSMPDKPFHWINLKDKIDLIVSNEKEILYSGECKIIKESGGTKRKSFILEPLSNNMQRFNPKKYRSNRLKLSPSPNIIFKHPFTHKSVNLKVSDISGSGVCVEDNEESSVLMPGMILPSLTLAFTIDFFFKCRAQVIYRQASGNPPKSTGKCGIAFLDMHPNDHMRLLSILHQASNPNLYICTDIDMDDLWDFFFKTGFLYPKKYAFIQKNKKEIEATYEKLYKSNSEISRHLTWHSKGVIQGHLALLRFYDNTWLIHHLAALKSDQQLRIGVEILKHIGFFTYDSHKLFSSHMDYLICYYRPENSFPNYFFGGVAQCIKNPNACSVDSFAYLHFRVPTPPPKNPDDACWSLVKSEYEDMVELDSFYKQKSGGVMIRALDLSPDEDMGDRYELANEYKKINLTRKRLLYSLKHENCLKAVIMVNVSDFALNLSDLTRCVSVFVVDPESLPVDRLYWAVSLLAAEYTTKKFPILIYPIDYLKRQAISYEKTYNLWSLDGLYSDDYFEHMGYLLHLK